MSEKRPFFSVPRTTEQTSEGPVECPILYYDTSVVMGAFLVDRTAADSIVSQHGLRLALSRGDHTVAVLAGFDYRATSIGPYYEVGLAIAVVPEEAPPGDRWKQILSDPESLGRDLGYDVLHLPVSTAVANAGGRELWGFPKFVTSIDVRHSGRDILMRVDDPDGSGSIMLLEGRAGVGAPAPTFPLVLYPRLNGQMLRTTVNARGGNSLRSAGSLRVRVGGGDHPMAQTMRQLGLDGARPLAVLTTHRFQSRLNLGVPIGSRSKVHAT